MIVQDFVESGKLEEDTGVVEPSVEVISLYFVGKELKELNLKDLNSKKLKSCEQAAQGGEILSTRTYDLNITYDKYYQVSFQITIILPV